MTGSPAAETPHFAGLFLIHRSLLNSGRFGGLLTEVGQYREKAMDAYEQELRRVSENHSTPKPEARDEDERFAARCRAAERESGDGAWE
jgi:hypothetical protein